MIDDKNQSANDCANPRVSIVCTDLYVNFLYGTKILSRLDFKNKFGDQVSQLVHFVRTGNVLLGQAASRNLRVVYILHTSNCCESRKRTKLSKDYLNFAFLILTIRRFTDPPHQTCYPYCLARLLLFVIPKFLF